MPDIAPAEKIRTEQLLQQMQTGHAAVTIPALRELLAHLNYDPLNDPIPREGWKDDARKAVAADPRIYGRAADKFYIIYCQLAGKLKLSEERLVVPQLLKQYPYALFVFSDKDQTNFHFVNVKWENTQKRRLYRRIAVGPQERLRTAIERVSMLDVQEIPRSLFDRMPQDVQDRHDLAFDVSEVTKNFYQEYKRVFEVMRDSVEGFGDSDEEKDRRHLFVQRLFNRLMFLRFIQKKGWLTIDGTTDYLAALWQSHRKTKQEGKNFYSDRLKFLFSALNDERAGIILQGGGGVVEATIGKVKYLNGGLFEETAEDRDSSFKIPDEPFTEIFDRANGLFEKFNFTITESTPLDIEVAVDPEMLGKIFEELVTGRHDTGSYYTPKPIVSFMCREALKGYLEAHVTSEHNSAIERFVDKHEPDEIRNAEQVLTALQRVTVCDPACGSGAYLLGMMHELLDLRECLFRTRQLDAKSAYDRKLQIIQNNIYGVDIADFAVNIARLRLWLSLSVDYDGPNPEPLPNLDYKIKCGDSICSTSPAALQMGLQQPLVHEFLTLKAQYLVAHHGDKSVIRERVEQCRNDICDFSRRDRAAFDWVVDFAEVFVAGGYDIVLANPPYISALDFSRKYEKAYRDKITSLFASTKGSYDIYIPFFERGLELLRPGGNLVFITPNKFLSAKYAAAFRAHCIEHAEVTGIVDLSSVSVFQTVSVYPVITMLKRSSLARPYTCKARTPLIGGDEDPSQYQKVEFNSAMLIELPENIWGFLLSNHLDLLLKVLADSTPLASLGIVAATSTASEADHFGEFITETENVDSKRLVNTGTIDPFRSLWGVRELTNAGKKYLTPYLDVVAAGASRRRREMYDSPKIIFSKMAKSCEAFYDSLGEYASINTNCFYRPIANEDDLAAVAAFCGSSLFMFIYSQFFGSLRMAGGYFQFQSPQLRVIPIRNFSAPERRSMVEFAARLTRVSCDEVEFVKAKADLDEFLAEIYGLNLQEAEIVGAS